MPDYKANIKVLYDEYKNDIDGGKLSEEDFYAKLKNPENRKLFFDAYKDDFDNAKTQDEFDNFLGFTKQVDPKPVDYFSRVTKEFTPIESKDTRVGVSSPKAIREEAIRNPASIGKRYNPSQSAALTEAVIKKKELQQKKADGDMFVKGMGGDAPLPPEDVAQIDSDIEDINSVMEDVKDAEQGKDFSSYVTPYQAEFSTKLRDNNYKTLREIDEEKAKLTQELSDGFVVGLVPAGKSDRLVEQKSALSQEDRAVRQQRLLELEKYEQDIYSSDQGTKIITKRGYEDQLTKSKGDYKPVYEIAKTTSLKNLTRLSEDVKYLYDRLPPEFLAITAKANSGQPVSEEEKVMYQEMLQTNPDVIGYSKVQGQYNKQRNQILFDYPEEAQKEFINKINQIAANTDLPIQIIAKTLSKGSIDVSNSLLATLKPLGEVLGLHEDYKTVEEQRKNFIERIGDEAKNEKGSALTGNIVEDVVDKNGIKLVVDNKGNVLYIRDADSDRKINEKRLTVDQKKFLEDYKANPSAFKSSKDFSHLRAIDAGLYSTVLMAPTIGASMLSGGALGSTSLATFVTMFGSSYEQGKELFADDPDRNIKAWLYALPQTAIQTAIELGMGGVELGTGKLLSSAAGQASKNWASKEMLRANGKSFATVLGNQIVDAVKTVGLREGKQVAGEMAEEALQQISGDVGAFAAGDTEIDWNAYYGLPLATMYGYLPMGALKSSFEKGAFRRGLIASGENQELGVNVIKELVSQKLITEEEGIRKLEIAAEYSKRKTEYEQEGLSEKELTTVKELLADRMLLEEQVQGVSENFLSNRIKSKISQINDQIKGIIEEGDGKEESAEEATPMGAETKPNEGVNINQKQQDENNGGTDEIRAESVPQGTDEESPSLLSRIGEMLSRRGLSPNTELKGWGKANSDLRAREDAEIKKEAKATGTLKKVGEFIKDLKFLQGGAEQRVYKNEDEEEVIKINTGDLNDSRAELFDRLSMHEEVFPETAYTLIGVVDDAGLSKDKTGFVLKQQFVRGEAATDKEIQQDLEQRGFTRTDTNSNGDFKKGNIVISDVFKEKKESPNVIKGKDGNLYYIDPMLSRSKQKNVSPEVQKLEQERDAELKKVSTPNLELSFIEDTNPKLNTETGKMVKVKAGNRETERPQTYKDVQKRLIKEIELLKQLINC